MPSEPRKDADGHFKNHNLPTVCPWASQDSAVAGSNNILVIISLTRCQITVNTNIIAITITACRLNYQEINYLLRNLMQSVERRGLIMKEIIFQCALAASRTPHHVCNNIGCSVNCR